MKNRNRSYTNGEITIFWRASECIHNTLCYRELRSVFDPAKRPWVNPQGAATDQILDIIERCPTLALTFQWNDPQRNQDEKSAKLYQGDFVADFITPVQTDSEQVKVNIRPNGPIIINGNFEIIENDTPLRPVKMASLCRCGASGNMPHCDGTHFKVGFRDQ